MTEEVFFVLFANRTFLHKFHRHLSHWVRDLEPETWLPGNDLFRKAGGEHPTLKRARIPEWAKRAVFFRDRGRCCRCERDLGGNYSPVNRAEYDHIVPLFRGGLNDVTNLQLLCNECNNAKRATSVEPSRVYERWFPTDRSPEYSSTATIASIVDSLGDTDETE
jgi:5-methylcytosine-specific restriction endonuclease McrA